MRSFPKMSVPAKSNNHRILCRRKQIHHVPQLSARQEWKRVRRIEALVAECERRNADICNRGCVI